MERGDVCRIAGPDAALSAEPEQLPEELPDCAADGIGRFACNDALTVLYMNQKLRTLLGAEAVAQGAASRRRGADYIHPGDLPRIRREAQAAFRAGRPLELRCRLRSQSDGADIYVRVQGVFTGQLYEDSPVACLLFTDMTELVLANEQLAMETKRYQAFAQLSQELFFEVDFRERSIVYYGKDVPAYPDAAVSSPENLEILLQAVQGQTGLLDLELQLYDGAGRRNWYHLRIHAVGRWPDRRRQILGAMENIQARREQVARLREQADHDAATGLCNRCAIQRAVEARIRSGLPYLCAILDVDNFKRINDSRGHVFGDTVLKCVADTLVNTCRPIDAAGRLGGDEFLVLYNTDFTETQARARMELVLERIEKDQRLLPHRAEVTVSIGAVLVNRPGLYFLDLYRRADLALYTAKAGGKNAYVLDVFTE